MPYLLLIVGFSGMALHHWRIWIFASDPVSEFFGAVCFLGILWVFVRGITFPWYE